MRTHWHTPHLMCIIFALGACHARNTDRDLALRVLDTPYFGILSDMPCRRHINVMSSGAFQSLISRSLSIQLFPFVRFPVYSSQLVMAFHRRGLRGLPMRALQATKATSHVISRASHSAAMRPWPTTHTKIAQPLPTHNFINNEFTPSAATKWIDVADPATNNTVTRVPESTDDELAAAVASAEAAFPGWKNTSIMRRQQIMFNYVRLIRENWDRLAASITLEQGKTLEDARGDVLRGLQVAETACGITTQIPGQVLEVAQDMETRNYREPLGVVAAICPFSKPLPSMLYSSFPRRDKTNLSLQISQP